MPAGAAVIGRASELAAMASVLDRAREGSGAVVLIGGEAGIGKTHLLRAVRQQARDRGMAVCVGGCELLERARPFGPFAQALGIPRDTAAAPSRFLVQEAIVDDVEARVAAAPLLLAVDDAQWADEPSLGALAALGRRARDLPLALVVAHRPTPRLPDRVVDVLLEHGGRALTLGPLTPDDVVVLVASVLGAPPGDGLRALVDGAHGNPFLVIELVEALRDEQAIAVHRGVAESSFRGLPPTLRQTVLRRVRSLSPSALVLLRAAVVLGGPFDVDTVAALIERSSVSLHGDVLLALEAGLLEEDGPLLRFRHDLIREAIYAHIPAAIQASLHGQAVRVLRARGAPATVVARHLVSSGGRGAADEGALDQLRRAVGELGGTDPDAALELLDRALALPIADGHRRAEMLGERVGLLAAAGRLAEGEATAREVLATQLPPRLRTEIDLALAEVLLLAGNPAAAVAVLDALRSATTAPATDTHPGAGSDAHTGTDAATNAEADPDVDTATNADADMGAGTAAARHAPTDANADADTDGDAHTDAGAGTTAARDARTDTNSDADTGAGTTAARDAGADMNAGMDTRTGAGTAAAGDTLTDANDDADTGAGTTAARDALTDADMGAGAAAGGEGLDDGTRARVDAAAAWARLVGFDLDGAERDAARAVAGGERHDDALVLTSGLSVQCRLAAFAVDFDRAIERGRAAVAASALAGPPAARRTPHYYLGLSLMNADRIDEAVAVLNEGRRTAEAAGLVSAAAMYHSALITCCFHSGRWDEGTTEAEAARLLQADTGTRLDVMQMEAMLGLMWFHRGDEVAARAALARAQADLATPGYDIGGVIWLRWLRAAFAEASGDVAEAARLLTTSFGLVMGSGVASVKLWFGPEVVRLAVESGDTVRAVEVATEVAEVAARAGTAGAAGAADCCAGIAHGDPDRLAAAVDAYRRSSRRFDLARAAEASGRLLADRGRTAEAIAAYDEASAVLTELGAAHHLRRVGARLRELGVRRGVRGARARPATGPESLTPVEHEVLRLVADGLANPQIAERLFVSRRTVETHVGHLYAKLGVRGRVALAQCVPPPSA